MEPSFPKTMNFENEVSDYARDPSNIPIISNLDTFDIQLKKKACKLAYEYNDPNEGSYFYLDLSPDKKWYIWVKYYGQICTGSYEADEDYYEFFIVKINENLQLQQIAYFFSRDYDFMSTFWYKGSTFKWNGDAELNLLHFSIKLDLNKLSFNEIKDILYPLFPHSLNRNLNRDEKTKEKIMAQLKLKWTPNFPKTTVVTSSIFDFFIGGGIGIISRKFQNSEYIDDEYYFVQIVSESDFKIFGKINSFCNKAKPEENFHLFEFSDWSECDLKLNVKVGKSSFSLILDKDKDLSFFQKCIDDDFKMEKQKYDEALKKNKK